MTPRQLRTLDFVREMLANGISPSVREIAKCLNLTVSGTQAHIQALVEAGALERGPNKVRNLRLPGIPDMRTIPSEVLAAELARRGMTLASLDTRAPRAVGRQVTCAADTCGAVVQRGHLMCRRHWFTLPPKLRTDILGAFGRKDVEAYQHHVATARDLIDGCGA